GTEMEPRLTAKLDLARPVANTASTAMVMKRGLGMGGEPTEGGNTHGDGSRMSMAETADAQAESGNTAAKAGDVRAKTPYPLPAPLPDGERYDGARPALEPILRPASATSAWRTPNRRATLPRVRGDDARRPGSGRYGCGCWRRRGPLRRSAAWCLPRPRPVRHCPCWRATLRGRGRSASRAPVSPGPWRRGWWNSSECPRAPIRWSTWWCPPAA